MKKKRSWGDWTGKTLEGGDGDVVGATWKGDNGQGQQKRKMMLPELASHDEKDAKREPRAKDVRAEQNEESNERKKKVHRHNRNAM